VTRAEELAEALQPVKRHPGGGPHRPRARAHLNTFGWENATALTGEAVAFSAQWTGLLDALPSTFVVIS